MSGSVERRLSGVMAEIRALARKRLADDRIPEELRVALDEYERGVDASRRRLQVGPIMGFGDVFALVLEAEGVALDEPLLGAAAGLELFMLSLSLFDAVEDEQLEPPLSALGSPVITNAALILFVQAMDDLNAPCERLSPEQGARYRQALTQNCLAMGRGQHGDLMKRYPGGEGAAIEQAANKCALHVLSAELPALVANASEARVACYRSIGYGNAFIRQAANDLRGLFQKESPDLAQERWSLPISLFRARASAAEQQRLAQLRTQLPDSLADIRALLFSSGAVAHLASLMVSARDDIESALLSLGPRAEALRPIQLTASELVGRLFAPSALASPLREADARILHGATQVRA